MAAPTLYQRYEDYVTQLKEMAIEAGIENHEEYIIIRMFEIINVRVIRLLKMMDVANASTLCIGLIEMEPTRNETYIDLIESLVTYHKQEKKALRKYRSNNGEITEISIEEMFDKMLLRTKNNIISISGK